MIKVVDLRTAYSGGEYIYIRLFVLTKAESAQVSSDVIVILDVSVQNLGKFQALDVRILRGSDCCDCAVELPTLSHIVTLIDAVCPRLMIAIELRQDGPRF